MLSRKNLIALLILIFTGASFYYFGAQNTTSQGSEKTLELTTVKISKGDLSKKEFPVILCFPEYAPVAIE